MPDEMNRIDYANFDVPPETRRHAEGTSYREVSAASEIQSYREVGDVHRKGTRREAEGKKARSRMLMISATAAVAAVAVLGLVPNSIFSPLFEPFDAFGDLSHEGSVSGGSGSFSAVDVTDTTVRYYVDVDEGSGTYTVTLTNRFTERSQTFTDATFTSIERDLRPGMTYTLTLSDAEGVMDTATVTTAREQEPVFTLVSAYCNCPVDGFFHLTVDIADGGEWSNFRAELEDRYGNVSSIAIHDHTAEQLIPVRTAGLEGDSAALRILCTDSDGATRLLYSGEVSI